MTHQAGYTTRDIRRDEASWSHYSLIRRPAALCLGLVESHIRRTSRHVEGVGDGGYRHGASCATCSVSQECTGQTIAIGGVHCLLDTGKATGRGGLKAAEGTHNAESHCLSQHVGSRSYKKTFVIPCLLPGQIMYPVHS